MAENKKALADYFTQQAGTLTGLAKGEQQQEEFAARTDLRRPSGFREQFSESVRAGAQQVQSDVATFGAIGNYLLGNEEEAQKKLNYANRLQESYGAILEPIGNFEQFLEQPTFDGFVDEVSKVGIVAPQALFSIASGGTGLLVGLLGKGIVTTAGKSAAKKMLVDLQKKKLNFKKGTGPALTPEENEILESVYQGLRAAKYTPAGQAEAAAALQAARASNIPYAQLGFWSGAFAQGEVVGASQSFQEYEEAGYELSADEAKMALLLGIPQATLDTLGERIFFGAITKKLTGDLVSEPTVKRILKKQADGGALSKADTELLQKAVGDIPAGVFLKDLGKAATTGFLFGGAQEGLTELGQEEILIQQRQAIDPNYAEEEANLRRAEAAFLGFFAGAGRSAPSNVLAKTINLMATGREVSADLQQQIKLQTGIGLDKAGDTVQESLGDLKAQFNALLDPKNARTVVFVPGDQTEATNSIVESLPDEEKSKINFVPTQQGTIFYDTSNPLSVVDGERVAKEGAASEETLKDILGFTETQLPTHENVVVAKDADGNILFRQTVSNTKEAIDAAVANAQRRNPGAIVETQTKEEAIAESKAKLQDETAEVRKVEDEDDFEVQQARAEGLETEEGTDELAPLAVAEEYVQEPVRKGSAQTKDAFWPVRNLSQKGESAKVDSKALEDLDLSGNIKLNEIPKKAVQRVQQLRKKYPTTRFVLEKSSEESFTQPGTQVPGFKIRQEGPLEPDIKVVVEDAIAQANDALGQQFQAGRETASTTFTVGDTLARGTQLSTEVNEGGAKPFTLTPVLIQSLLENKELIPDSDLTDSQGTFLTGRQRLQRQFELLLGQLALAEKELFYNGQSVLLSGTRNNQILDAIEVQVFRGGRPIKTTILYGERAGLATQITNFLEKQKVTLDQNRLDTRDTGRVALSSLPYLVEELSKLSNTEAVQKNERTQQIINSFINRANRLNETDIQRQNARIVDALEKAGVEEIPTLLDSAVTTQAPEGSQGVLLNKAENEARYQEALLETAAENQVEVGFITGIDFDPDSVNPEVVDEIGVFEPERYKESDAQKSGLPLTRLNMEEGEAPRTYLSEKKAKTKPPAVKRKPVDQFSASPSVQEAFGAQLFQAYQNILTRLGMKENIRFMSVDDVLFTKDTVGPVEGETGLIAQGLDLQKEYAIEEDGVTKFVNANDLFETQKQSLINSPASARFIRFGNQNIVLIDPNKYTGGRSQTSQRAKEIIDISHEVGHAFFYTYKNDIIGTPLGKLLQKDFEKARKRLEAEGSRKYSNPKTGFDEWFADQFTIWTQKSAQNESAKNRVDSYFRTLVNSLKGFYELISKLVYNSRFSQSQLSQTFEEFMSDVSESVKAGEAFDPLTTAEKFQVAEDIENVAKNAEKFGIDRKTLNYFKNKAIEMLKSAINTEFTFLPEDKKHWSVSYIFRTAAGYLKDISPELSRAFYKPSVTEGDPGYLNIRIRRFQKYLNQVVDLRDGNGVFYFRNENGTLDLDKFNAAALIAEDDTVPTDSITDPGAKAIRQWLDGFYENYIKPSGLPIPKSENFFTRQWDKGKIVNDNAARLRLVQLLEQYNPDAKDAKGNSINWSEFVTEWSQEDDTLNVSDVSVGVNPERQKYFKKIPNKVAREQELLVPPGAAVRTYIDNITRQVEYNNSVTTVITEADVNNPDIKGVIILPKVPVVPRVSKNKGDKTKGGWAAYNRAHNKIYLDEDELKRTFDEKAWSKPKVEGVNALSENQFKTIEEWRDFVIAHESAHAKFPQKEGESKAQYENRMNEIALDSKKVGDTVNGHQATEVMLGRIKDPIKRQGARHSVRNMLGKAGHDMSPLMRKLNSYGLLVNMVTLLPYAMIASLPDLAGPMIRSKGMVTFKEYFGQLKYAFKNKQEAETFARDLGLITHDALHTMYVNAYELGFMDENAKAFGDKFFKVIGLDWYTKFTRVFAAGMGQRYLIKLAQDNSAESNRYLKELNLTRDQIIKAYDRSSGTLDTSSDAIKDALATFVDESILRPNAAERPAWASNPYTALIFQLKSFFYAFGVNIMGGLIRETKNSYNEKGIPGAAVPLVLAASTLLPLSMIGLEIREFIKYLGRGVTPGILERPLRGVETQDTFTYSTAFRTDGMPWGDYFLEILDRAGVFGPFGLIFPMADSARFGDAWFTPAFGPTVERFEDLLIDGDFRFRDVYPF